MDGGAAGACAEREEGEVAYGGKSVTVHLLWNIWAAVPINCWLGSSRKTEW